MLAWVGPSHQPMFIPIPTIVEWLLIQGRLVIVKSENHSPSHDVHAQSRNLRLVELNSK